MLDVTESAKQEMKRLLLARTEDPDISLRLEGEPGQFRIKLDSEVPGDQVLEYEGAKVLLVEPALALLLEGKQTSMFEILLTAQNWLFWGLNKNVMSR